jgi:hypothetical protein
MSGGGVLRDEDRLKGVFSDPGVSNTARRIAYATQNALSPLSQAADVIAAYSVDQDFVDTVQVENGLKCQAEALVRHKDTSALEVMLVGQAYGLNSAFQALMVRASQPEISRHPERLQTCLNMALKAQRQAVSTIELISMLKNPPAPFIQQNISPNQQVNNVCLENPSNKLLRGSYETLDTGRTATAEQADPELAALEAIDGAEDR